MTFLKMNDNYRRELEDAYNYILAQLFPDKYITEKKLLENKDIKGILNEVRNYIRHQEFSMTDSLILLEEDEIQECRSKSEYMKFREFWENNYINELMLIGREITPFNTLGHVCGVHYVAMHVAGQMKQAGFPIDTALVSAAAAAHDLGKYGCTGDELGRVPYLHYYYTEELLKRNEMPLTAKLAGNHSVWDLERDNLSAEWMILIYADFRVKSFRNDSGEEIITFTSLDEAFDVILNKLDDVDESKAARYKRAYARLKKFEDYMIYLGVDPELDGHWSKAEADPEKAKKFMLLDYQLRMASEFNYLSQEKMEAMLAFLADSFYDRSPDARRQTVMIMREIINNYDQINNKELPEGAMPQEHGITADDLKERYKEILTYDETSERLI